MFARDVTERREMFARMALADRMLTVGTLAAGVAHEINNPLSYVATNLEILATRAAVADRRRGRRVPREDSPALVGDAREGVARVSAIVRDLRALARPEDDARGPVDVAAVLASSIKMASNEIRHRARVVESYAPDLPPVRANASRLGQVFLNLLLNAAQAIPEGRADHERDPRAARADGDRVVVEIEDTGVGIPPAMHQADLRSVLHDEGAAASAWGSASRSRHQIVRALDGDDHRREHARLGHDVPRGAAGRPQSRAAARRTMPRHARPTARADPARRRRARGRPRRSSRCSRRARRRAA